MKSQQRGATLITAIFLITVIASLAAIGVQIGASQRQTVNFAALGDRAYAAAQSGIEWGAYRALNGNCAANSVVNLVEGALNGFTVRVFCTRRQPTDCGPYDVYEIDARARWGTFGTPEYTYRQIVKQFTNAPC
jgi:MSHA biogenesis protein MshP